MTGALLCVPNVSEGRRADVVERIVSAARDAPDVRLLYSAPDPDHNRSVLAYVGAPEAVLEATKAVAAAAFDAIDMSTHSGQHPRLGAVDVVPFIPARNVSREEALEVCRRFGRWVGARGVPVYYYEEAALREERRSLPDLRRGEYEGLRERLATPEGAPDEGPARFHEEAGACVTGVRGPLIAFNVNLRTDDLDVARRIATAVRHIGGGYRYVRAIGVALRERGMVQVSMNLVRPEHTPIARVFETVRSEARRYGVPVAGSEIVGPVPAEALVHALRHRLRAHDLTADQIVELALLD